MENSKPKSRKDITSMLSAMTEKHIGTSDVRVYWAKEVTFHYGTAEQVRVDYMQFKPINNSVSGIEKGDFYCYEIKSSVADFKSKNGHNYIGDYNYYVMPKEVYNKIKDFVPYYVGVLVPSEKYEGRLSSIKKAKRHNRTITVAEMLLMMFRSANRDRNKDKD